MKTSFNSRLASRSQGKALRGVAVLAAVFLVAGAFAFRFLFPRPGEEAIRLIPADALLVVTLDTKPSTRQVATFEKIAQALNQEGLSEKIEETLGEWMLDSPVVAQLRSHVSNDFAYALMAMPKGREMEGNLLFLSMTNPEGARSVLRKHGTASRQESLEVFRFQALPQEVVAVIEPYVVVASDASLLARVEKAREARTSVATLPEYQAARAELPEDANFMVFASPRGLGKWGEMIKEFGANPMGGGKWLALSATIREDGLAVDVRYPFDAKAMPGMSALGEIAPLDMAALKKLPEGAYGLFAYSQPGKYWAYLNEAFAQAPEGANALKEAIAWFERETGIGIEKDLLPALGGDLWVAVYPDGDDKDSAVDLLVLLDDANGAAPAKLAETLRAALGRAGKDRPVTFRSARVKSATVYAIDSRMEESLRKQLAGRADFSSAAETDMTSFRRQMITDMKKQAAGMPAESRASYERMIRDMERDLARSAGTSGSRSVGTSAPKTADYLKDKTVLHAEIGNALLIASSRRMLDRALAAWEGSAPSLATQDAYKAMVGITVDRAQSVAMVNLAAIMRRLQPEIAKGMKGSVTTVSAEDVAGIFGPETTGWVMSGRFDGTTTKGSFFLPLDYEKIIKLIGSAVRDVGAKVPAPSGSLLLQ